MQPRAPKQTAQRQCGRGQRGFALLLVFAMAAVVAVTLYMQLPRVAFEAQRDREGMLVQRGEEYKRAIELYVRKNNRYPARIEDLERDQEVRYLRRRYKDPLTGKDDWRLIHINAAGQLEDSLIEKPKSGTNEETASTTETAQAEDENVAENTALARQRPGDQVAANAQFPGGAGAGAGAVSPPSADPYGNSGQDDLVPLLDASGNVIQQTKTEAEAQAQQGGLVASRLGNPNGQDPNAPQNPNAPGDPNNPAGNAESSRQVRLGPGGIPIIEDTSAFAAPTIGNIPGRRVPGGQGVAGAPPPGTIPVAGSAASGQRAGTAPGQGGAKELLQGLLTTPVPGGLAGIQQRRGIQPTTATAGGAQGFGAGIAGVASKYEMRGIKVYEDQESIHKWEFVFDARKAAGNTAQSGARAAQGQQGVGVGIGGGFGSNSGGNRSNSNRTPRGSGNNPGGFGAGNGPGSGGQFGSFGQGPAGSGGARPGQGRRP